MGTSAWCWPQTGLCGRDEEGTVLPRAGTAGHKLKHVPICTKQIFRVWACAHRKPRARRGRLQPGPCLLLGGHGALCGLCKAPRAPLDMSHPPSLPTRRASEQVHPMLTTLTAFSKEPLPLLTLGLGSSPLCADCPAPGCKVTDKQPSKPLPAWQQPHLSPP